MDRRITLGSALGLFAVVSSVVSAQSMQPISPAVPPEVSGPRLILWSQAEKPQPMPLPLPQSAVPKSKETKRHVAAPMRTLFGAIVKDGSRYVLRTSNEGIYQLDDQGKSSQYEGREVRLLGMIEEGTRIVVIANVEPLS